MPLAHESVGDGSGLSLPVALGRRAPGQARATNGPDDQALAVRLFRGEEEALGVLFDRYGRHAYALARQIVRDVGLAEDAVQEAFVALWRNAPAYRPESAPLRSYLLMLVHRRAVDIVRREQRQRITLLRSEGEEPDAAADGKGMAEETERVQTALQALPHEQREVVLLAYFGGLTQAEVATRLAIPVGTVKSRIFNAMSRLRALLDER